MARDPYYEPDNLFLPDDLIMSLLEKESTPLYLYDAQGIRNSVQALKNAFAWSPGYRQYFPVKTLNTPGILKLLLQAGIGLLCTTRLELELAMRVGATVEDVLFVPVLPTRQELSLASKLGTSIVLDSEAVLNQLLELGELPKQIGLRLHPTKKIEVGTRTIARTDSSKFGMDVIELRDLARRLSSLGVKQIGLHCHVMGGITESRYWGKILALLFEAGEKIQKKVDIEIAYYDVGGGLNAGSLGTRAVNIERVAEHVHNQAIQRNLEKVPVYTEFGRYVTGPNGILLSRVCEIKPFYEEQRPIAIVDAGITKMMRHWTNSTDYHVSVVGRRETEGRLFYSLAGPLNEPKDRLMNKKMLPQLQVGDVIAIHGIGAYSACMDNTYAGQLCCSEYLFENDSLRCLRRAQTEEDYFANMIF